MDIKKEAIDLIEELGRKTGSVIEVNLRARSAEYYIGEWLEFFAGRVIANYNIGLDECAKKIGAGG